MKIAIFDMDNFKNPFWGSGQARATREVGKRLALKHDVTVYCSKYPGYKDYAEDGIKYVHIGLNCNNARLTNIAYIFSVPLFVRHIKADVIIENFNAPVSVSFAPIFTKIPIVALPTMFNAIRFAKKYHLPFDLIEKAGIKFYKYMMPYSEIDSSKALCLNPKIKYRIIPQGVSTEFFKIRPKNPEYILFLGRFDIAQKGIDLLLEAYAKIADKIKYPLVIAGHGPDEKEINKIIKRLNLEEKVIFFGPAYGKMKNDLISKALFCAFPSRHDEMSLWTLEALACGLPIVCFNLPESLWLNNKVSLKAKAFDREDYSRLLLKAADKNLLSEMSRESRKFAKKYTWEKVAEQFEGFLKFVIKDNNLRATEL